MKTRRDTLFGFTGLAALALPISAKAAPTKIDLLSVFKEIQEIGDNMITNREAIFDQRVTLIKEVNDEFTEMVAQKLDTDVLSSYVYIGWNRDHKRIEDIYWIGYIGKTKISFTFKPHTNDILNSYTKRT